jgi:predicted RND superfamily exporter protein
MCTAFAGFMTSLLLCKFVMMLEFGRQYSSPELSMVL